MGGAAAAEVLKEVEIQEAPAPAPELPESTELKEQGLDPREVEMAQRHGLVKDAKPKKEKAGKKQEAPTPEPPPAPEQKKEEAPAPAAKPKGDIFETMPELFEGMTEEEKAAERTRLQGYNKNEIGLYTEVKKLRKRAQEAEGDKDFFELQTKKLQDDFEKFKKEIEAKATPAPAKPKTDDDILKLLEDEEEPAPGQKPQPKYLTEEDLARIEKEKADKANKEAEAKQKAAQELTDALNRTETFAKQKYKDFDAVTDLADDLMKNYETIFKDDPIKQQEVAMRLEMFYSKVLGATKTKLDNSILNSADIAVMIGRMHPNYKPDSTGKHNADAGGDRNPEKVQKMLENANRRSSASVNGGNSAKLVSVDDLTIEQIRALPQAEFRRLPRHVRDKALGRIR